MGSSGTWLTVAEVAEELRVPPARVYSLIRDPEHPLPARRITPRTIRIDREVLRGWLDTRRTPRTEADGML